MAGSRKPCDTEWIAMEDAHGRRPVSKRVWFHRVCAMIWLSLFIPAYLWWRDAIFFVIAASIYANIKSDWAASEAADDSQVMRKLDEIQRGIDALTEKE